MQFLNFCGIGEFNNEFKNKCHVSEYSYADDEELNVLKECLKRNNLKYFQVIKVCGYKNHYTKYIIDRMNNPHTFYSLFIEDITYKPRIRYGTDMWL